MIMVYFSGWDSQGEYRNCIHGGDYFESSFDILSGLVAGGWKLVSVKLSDGFSNEIYLPIEFFDGQPIKKPMRRLQYEWEEILY